MMATSLKAYTLVHLVLGVSIMVNTLPGNVALGPKTILILTDGVELTTDQCGATGSAQNVAMSNMLSVVSSWLRSVSSEDIDFRQLSSACGDAKSSVLQLMEAITTHNVVGILAMTSSQTGQAIADVMKSVDVPFVQVATGNDVVAAPTNQNRFLVSHYIENQLSISLNIIDSLNWTAFAVDSESIGDVRSMHHFQEAAIDKRLCILPDIHSQSTPRVILHSYSRRGTPTFACYENVLYLGSGIDNEFVSLDCNNDRTILAVEFRDGKWSNFCLTLLRSNLNNAAKPQSLLNLCSADLLYDANAADTAMNAGNVLAGLSFLLRSSNIIVREGSCSDNLITRYVCSMFGDSLYETTDVLKGQIVGKQIQTSYRIYESNIDQTVQRQISLSDAPTQMTNRGCKELCHLCYQCNGKKNEASEDGISISRDSGDLFLVGLFPLHTSSSTEACDVTNPLGQAQALAFLHAVNDVTSNSKSSKLVQSVRGVVLDSCHSPFKTSSLIHSIHACEGTWTVSGVGNNRGFITLQPGSILGYFHASSHQMDIDTIGHQPVVSVTKSGFSSSKENSKIFVQHLLDVLTRLDWTTVNVIVSSHSFFEAMHRHLTTLPKSQKFCFVKEITLISNRQTDVANAIIHAVQKSTVFLLLTSERDTSTLLNAISGTDFGNKLQFVFTPWNENVQESPVVQALTDENIILESLVDPADLNDVESMMRLVDFSTYALPGNVGTGLDFGSLVTQHLIDITHVVSSVRRFFSVAMATDGRVTRGLKTSSLKVESTGLVVVAEDVLRRLKQTIAYVDGHYRSLEFFSSSLHSQCRGWCPECHTCRGKPDTSQTFFHQPGELIITGLFPLHKEGSQAFQCGREQDNQADYLNVFAFIFALETFRFRYPDLPGSLSIGGLVLDSCSSSFTAIRTISDFETCGVNFDRNQNRNQNQTQSQILGSTSISSQAPPSAYQNLGYLVVDNVMNADALKSTLSGSAFGDVDFITNELIQSQYVARAILNIVARLGWTHLFLIAENSPYYQSIAQEIISRSTTSDLCIVFQTVFEARYEWRVESALDGYEHFPVVLISRKSSAYSLFDWLGDFAKSYFWILTAVTADWSDVDPNTVPLGSIVLKSPPTENDGFTSWLNKPLDNAAASTWLTDYWQYRYSCQFDSDDSRNVDALTPCSMNARKDETYVFTPVTSYIIRTVDAIIHKAQAQHFKLCQGQTGICPDITDDILGKRLGARDVSFVYQGDEIEVDANGLVSVTLNIFNIQRSGSVKVGSFFRSSLAMAKDNVSLLYPNGSAYHVTRAACRHRCSCVISANTSQSVSDILPSYLYREYKGEFLGDLWAIVVSAVAGTGALVTIVLISYVLYKVCKRAIGRRYVGLGLFLLASLISLYCSVLPFVISANDVICGLRFLFHGVAFALVFAGILVKLMSIQSYKIIGLGGDISNVNQFITVFFVVGVQVAISVMWWVYNSPMLISKLDLFDVEKYTCDFDRSDFAFFHVYLAALLLISSFYAIAVRKEKKNMGEAKLLMISCLICVVLWVAWAVCLFVLDREHSDLVTCAAILSCATTIMLVIFVPKIRMVAGLKYSISQKDAIKNGYSIDTDFFYERPFSLPGTLTSTFSSTKINPPKPLSHLNSDVNY